MKCRGCSEGKTRLKELREEVSFLRALVNRLAPGLPNTSVSMIEMEADSVLSGNEAKFVTDDSPAPLSADDLIEIERERDRLLSGNY